VVRAMPFHDDAISFSVDSFHAPDCPSRDIVVKLEITQQAQRLTANFHTN
jgi:hypothetical protein